MTRNPSSRIFSLTYVLSPSMIATTAITDMTATTFPRTVRTERSLFARSALTAIRQFSTWPNQESRGRRGAGFTAAAFRRVSAARSRPVALDAAVAQADDPVGPVGD